MQIICLLKLLGQRYSFDVINLLLSIMKDPMYSNHNIPNLWLIMTVKIHDVRIFSWTQLFFFSSSPESGLVALLEENGINWAWMLKRTIGSRFSEFTESNSIWILLQVSMLYFYHLNCIYFIGFIDGRNLAVWPWTSHCTSRGFSFIICKMRWSDYETSRAISDSKSMII